MRRRAIPRGPRAQRGGRLIGARQVQALAYELEVLGRGGKVTGADLMLTRLNAAYQRACEAVAAVAEAHPVERLAS